MENLTFEEALKQLEEKVQLLEKGDKSLDDTLKIYDEAVKLSGYCSALLNTAKMKISELNISEGNTDE